MSPIGIRLLLVAAVYLLGAACSKGPEPLQPGSPAFFWSTANQAYKNGDFIKTADTLAQVTATENEFSARARVWMVVVGSGIVQGNAALADAYENGAKMNRTNPLAFRKQASTARAAAAQSAVRVTEAIHKYMDGGKEPNVALAFAMPAGDTSEPAVIGKLAKGILPQGAEAEGLQLAMVRRGVILSACRTAGQKSDPAKADPAKAAEVFAKGELPRERFLMVVAETLYDQADLFGSKKLDQPQRIKLLLTEALEALGSVPPSKETKALDAKIKAAMKKAKVAS